MKLEGFRIAEASSYVYLGRSINMENDLKKELNMRRRVAWAAFRKRGNLRPDADVLVARMDQLNSKLIRIGILRIDGSGPRERRRRSLIDIIDPLARDKNGRKQYWGLHDHEGRPSKNLSNPVI
ncbi:unnamed protein product [Strongylus vulgaris]|uniref:Reverse transcriptase domain-containing protein n=1 Tax=Strongylus vulgaris TaxID=40348 RepID=A0A3P7IGV9_STRVU|nr:unnamed protein product [Strongylus vulgaris]